jgi:hypothetical protein
MTVTSERPAVCKARARSVDPDCEGLYDREALSRQAWDVLDDLTARGWTAKVIASASGLPWSSVRRALKDAEHGPRRLFTEGNATAVIEHGPPSVGWVGAVGATRRARALIRYGHDRGTLTAETGLCRDVLAGVLRGSAASVTPRTWASVAYAFRRLSRRVGDSPTALLEGRAMGWAPPYAWDGLDIDDPAVTLPDYPRADTPLPDAKRRAKDLAKERDRKARANAARRARRAKAAAEGRASG